MTHPALVSSDWLAERLGDAAIRVLDGSYHLPNVQRDAIAEFLASHIPGAAFFDIEAVSDHESPLPHMLPGPEAFAEAVGEMGIDNQTHVVAYDAYGLMSAARVWWMFRYFGHDRVSVLDGGFPKWVREGRPVQSGATNVVPRRFRASPRPQLVRSKSDVVAQLGNAATQIVDARAAARFAGTAPEPRPGLRSGRIPGSKNLPFTQLLDPDVGTVLPPLELAQKFAAAGISTTVPTIASCGSGVTACVVALGLYQLGAEETAIYDGSWSEWGLEDGPPIEKG